MDLAVIMSDKLRVANAWISWEDHIIQLCS